MTRVPMSVHRQCFSPHTNSEPISKSSGVIVLRVISRIVPKVYPMSRLAAASPPAHLLLLGVGASVRCSAARRHVVEGETEISAPAQASALAVAKPPPGVDYEDSLSCPRDHHYSLLRAAKARPRAHRRSAGCAIRPAIALLFPVLPGLLQSSGAAEAEVEEAVPGPIPVAGRGTAALGPVFPGPTADDSQRDGVHPGGDV